MSGSSDVAVVGAGIVGLAAADALQARGADVAMFDDGVPGQGQSAGAGRVFRRLHDAVSLVRLADEARDGWLEWGERAGAPLLAASGWLRRGGDRERDLERLGSAALEVQPEAALARLPAIVSPPGPLLLDRLGGTLDAAAAVAALVRWTESRLRRAEVRAISTGPDRGVRLETSEGRHTCKRCLVCAGAGSDFLAASAGVELRQQRRAHVRLTFALRERAGAPMPAWSDRSGDFGELVYGVPVGRDAYALGIAHLDAYPRVAGPVRSSPAGVELDRVRDRIVAYARAAFPGVRPAPIGEVARLTTTLSGVHDDGFALTWRGPVGVFAGGNLFKLAPVLGPVLAEAALAGEPSDWHEPATRGPEPATGFRASVRG